MAEELLPIQENEYKELLRQAVAVIENARASVAFHLAVTASRNPMVRRRTFRAYNRGIAASSLIQQ